MGTAEKMGKRIRALRELKSLTQEQLAERSDTSSQYISALERGQKNVTLDMLEKVAGGLSVDLLSLFSFDSSNERPSRHSLKRLIDQTDDKDIQKIAKIISILSAP
jgi:transcriptional regulator with XRE-family HTH domain